MERSPAIARARDAVWIALAISLGCTKSELTTFDLRDRDAVIAFLVVLDDRDGVTRATRPFGVEEGSISFGERPQVELTADEAAAVLIELERAAFIARHPDFELVRATELAVERRAPPPAEIIDGTDPLRATKQSAIDAIGTRLTDLLEESELAADSDRARAILAQLTLTLPSDPEYCRPTNAAFAPYGAETTLIADSNSLMHSLDGAILLDGRAILRTPAAVHLVDRGGTIDRMRSFLAPLLLHDVALDPTRARLMAVSSTVVFELSLGDRIEYVRRALEVDGAELERVAISSEGRTAVLSEDGSVYLEEPNGSFSVRRIDDPDPDPKARAILWTEDAARPLLATSRNRIQVWAPSTDRFGAEVLVTPTEMSVHLNALAADGPEIWAGGTGGFIIRLTSGAFERIEPRLPPRYLGCATTQGGLGLFADEILDLALHDGFAYVVLAQCSAVMAIRTSDRCVSLLSVDGAEPHLLDEDVDGLRSVRASNGEVLVTDAAGRALILSL